ncbi:MAG: hypothetical protein WBD99_00130 [Thermodesulfobacteriota bacterium]
MNRLLLSTVNVIVLLFPCLSFAGDEDLVNPYITNYPFKSAVIHYAIKSEYGHDRIYRGTEVVSIKGDKLAKLTKMAVPDPKETTKTTDVETLQIFTPDYIYRVNLTGKIGVKTDNSKKYGKVAYENLSLEEKKAFYGRMEKKGIISFDLLGLGKKVGTDTILGRQCDVYESGEKLSSKELFELLESGQEYYHYNKSWIWRTAKIPLKIITEQIGSSHELIATKIEEKRKIPDSRFIAPSDVKVTYDKESSEFAKKRALARFERYRTGKPMVIRQKVEKREVKPSGDSKASESKGKSTEAQ